MKKLLLLLTICFVSINITSARYESFINVVGVDNHGQGIMGNVTVEIQPGKGRVLVDTTPLQGIYTQDSERIAVKVASDTTGFDFSNYDNDRLKKELFITPEIIDSQSSGCMKSLFNRNNNDCFQMKQLTLNGSYEICEDSFYSLTILKGAGKLVSTDCELTLRPGSRFFIPASTNSIQLNSCER